MKGSGSIRKRGDSYEIRVAMGKDPVTGRYINHYETSPDSGTAKKRLHDILSELDRDTFVKPGKTTMGEYLTAWLADYVKPNLAPRTHELYQYMCTKHIIPKLGNIPIADLKPIQVQHLYSDKQSSGLSRRTVQLIHTTLHKALSTAVKGGVCYRNIIEAVDSPKMERREPHTMNETDIHLLLEMARNTEYYPLFYVILFTGMRRCEALALTWGNVDMLLCQLSVTRSMEVIGKTVSFKQPKTLKSRRLIALSPSTVAALREHHEAQNKLRQSLGLPALTDDDLIFSHLDGKPLLPNSVTHAWIKLARRAGLKGIRLHDARHTHASLLLKQGVHAKVVQERLGHAGIAITLDLYSHVAPGMQQAAANKFDDIVIKR